MTKRLLLEGPDVRELLSQVRDDYGDDARIVAADRIRSGGVAGFFAKERYELTVEIDDDAIEPSRAKNGEYPGQKNSPISQRGGRELTAGNAVADSVDGLIAIADAQDRGDTGGPARAPTGSPGTGTSPAGPSGRAARPPAAYPAEPAAPAEQARPSMPPAMDDANGIAFTPAADFDQVLAALRRNITTERAPREPAGPLADLPQRPRPPLLTAPWSAEPPEPSEPPSSEPAEASEPAEPPEPAEASRFPEPSTPWRPDLAPAVPRPAAAPPPGRAGERAGTGVGADPLHSRLAALGVPEALAARATGHDPYAAIVQALSTLPPTPWPPSRPGDVLVIAGTPEAGLEAATRVARAEQLSQSDILLAAGTTAGTGVHPSRRISGPADALRRARRMHRSDTAHLVVVATSAAEEDDGEWVRSICDALGASAVWAVVDATRKTTDTRRHLDALGPVHGLVVHGLRATADPGTVLALDVPIVYLDGRRASPAVWAGLLCERLEGAAR